MSNITNTNNIPIIINIITKNDIILKSLVGNNLDDCFHKILLELKPYFDMKIDYPLSYNDFEIIYLENCLYQKYIFDYKIYDKEWIKPWSNQDIYDNILELIMTHDIQEFILNPITYNDECDDSYDIDDTFDT